MVSSCGVSVRLTSVTGAKAETISDTGANICLSPPSSLQTVFIDSESLPTGMAIPSSGHSSIPTVRTVSNRFASCPGSPAAAIQFAERRMSEIFPIAAQAILQTASAMAMRPEAGPSITARGVRSPIAIASPLLPWNPLRVTAASATGTCHGPTIWSRVTRPPTERSPMVIRNDLLATAGKRRMRRRVSLQAYDAGSKSSPANICLRTSRNKRGILPSKTSSGISTGSSPSHSSDSFIWRLSVAWPRTAKGQRSRWHMASNN